MTVSNGQLANQDTFNNAFVSKTTDSTMVSKLTQSNTDPASGSSVTNTQREHNSIASFVGKAINAVYNLLPTWISNTLGATTDTLKDRIEAHDAAMDNTLGHDHDGTQGGGAPISITNLTGVNQFFATIQTLTIDTVSGTTFNASTAFSGQTPGGGTSQIGTVTSAPDNRIEIRHKSTEDQIEDGGGQKVYARLTESAGTWTLSFFTNEAGVETAHSLSSTDLRVYYRIVFNQSTRPTFPADVMNIGSLDYTADIVDASATQRGAVSTGTQTLAGAKTWNGAQLFEAAIEAHATTDAATTGTGASVSLPAKTSVRFTNGSLVSISNVGAGAEGRLLLFINRTGGSFNLVNDSGGTAANRILTGTGSDMTLINNAAAWLQYDITSARWNVVGGSGAGFTLAAVGSTPNANGASYSAGTFNLQPANASLPGVWTAIAQTLGGDKTMNGNMTFNTGFPGWAETPYTTGGTDPVVIPSKPYIRFTDNTLVSIGNINNTTVGPNAVLIIANLTGNSFTIKNDTTGTAAYRILTGTGANITLPDLGMLFLIYDLVASRWRVIGGSAAAIFSGTDVKILKDNLDFNGNVKIFSGTVDPTGAVVAANKGSLYLNNSTGFTYRKLDNGSSTNWEILGSTSGNKNYITNNEGVLDTTGWVTYADAAGQNPVDGTGGSPTVTW
ncbi:MAG: hypothetical protein ABIP54_04730, partial [Candidatus Andersenbacteria bacterium]